MTTIVVKRWWQWEREQQHVAIKNGSIKINCGRRSFSPHYTATNGAIVVVVAHCSGGFPLSSSSLFPWLSIAILHFVFIFSLSLLLSLFLFSSAAMNRQSNSSSNHLDSVQGGMTEDEALAHALARSIQELDESHDRNRRNQQQQSVPCGSGSSSSNSNKDKCVLS